MLLRDEMTSLKRCAWAETHPLLQRYHDDEWGVPQRDSRALWEALVLDGFQAGLAWITILRKRDAFRVAFEGFDPKIVARYTDHDIDRLMQNSGIVRSLPKINAAIAAARAYLAMQSAGEDFSEFVWSMTGGKPIQNTSAALTESPLSRKLSSALKERGFKFVGPVIVYAWMQAMGLINDHGARCFRRKVVKALA